MTVLRSLQAYNSVRGIGNPLHDDDSARALGYKSSLVPGVDIYGYLTHAAVARWGSGWLAGGSAECKLLKPVFDGETCELVCDAPDAPEMRVELRVDGETKAVARFAVPGSGAPPADSIAERALPAVRPPGSRETLAAGTVLGTLHVCQQEDEAAAYLRDQREDLALYRDLSLVHPGYLLRNCNFALSRNVALGAWIHAASSVRNFAAVPVGAPLALRVRVAANYEKNGHSFVDLEIVGSLGTGEAAVRILHTAIYAPRPKPTAEISR